ncbi:MAG: hypothetical protein Q8M74_04380, partial [Chloroflexota bacterium]|nr:hypothetical protein [Chloroflexota bacterium]
MFHLVPGRRAVRPATILLAALLSFGLIGVGPARADDFGFKEYTFSSSTCITKKDPINAYYVGNPLGYPSSAKTAVENGLGLKSTLFMSDQYFNAF